MSGCTALQALLLIALQWHNQVAVQWSRPRTLQLRLESRISRMTCPWSSWVLHRALLTYWEHIYIKRDWKRYREEISRGEGGITIHSSVVRNVSQTNRRARSLSLLTIGGQWVCGWSTDSPGQKMPRLPGRGDTYGDETIFCSQDPRKCGSNIPQCLPQTCFPKQLQN